jgi:tRNA A-37 threonylcarbamoyl transferase component Bud32
VTTSQVQDYKVVINKKKVYRFKEIDEKLKKKFRTIILNLVKKE